MVNHICNQPKGLRIEHCEQVRDRSGRMHKHYWSCEEDVHVSRMRKHLTGRKQILWTLWECKCKWMFLQIHERTGEERQSSSYRHKWEDRARQSVVLVVWMWKGVWDLFLWVTMSSFSCVCALTGWRHMWRRSVNRWVWSWVGVKRKFFKDTSSFLKNCVSVL